MKKSISNRITAISMALLMLMSSTGFSVDAHYCQDQLKGISFFGKAKSCHDIQDTPSCHDKKMACHNQSGTSCQKDEKDCCHNERINVDKIDVDAISLQIPVNHDIKLDFADIPATVFVFNYPEEQAIPLFQYYTPPLPSRDIQVLYQSFLI